MKQLTFEEYLQDQFSDTSPEVLDDDMPDAFDAWLGDMDVNEVMKYAEAFGRKIYLDGFVVYR